MGVILPHHEDDSRHHRRRIGPGTRHPCPAGGGRGGRGGRGGAAVGPSELWLRTVADGRETKILSHDAGIGGVSWSPDGAYILYNVGGGSIRHEQTPAYSGTKIVYTINENTP